MKFIHFFSTVVTVTIFVSESVVKQRFLESRRRHPLSGRFIPLAYDYDPSPENSAEIIHPAFDHTQRGLQVRGAAVPISPSSPQESNINKTLTRNRNQTITQARIQTQHSKKYGQLYQKALKGNMTVGLNSTTPPAVRNAAGIETANRNQAKRNNLSTPHLRRQNSRGGVVYKNNGRVPLVIDKNRLASKDNATRLSFMLHRLIKTHNISHVLDIWCMHGMVWLPDLLRKLEFEVPNFQYRCIVPDETDLVNSLIALEKFDSAIVLKHTTPWNMTIPTHTDLAILWHTVGFHPPHMTWKMVKLLQSTSTKYVIVPNFPNVTHNAASGTRQGRVNVRRTPYRFDQPLRVVNNMSIDRTVPKQLLMYNLRNIRGARI